MSNRGQENPSAKQGKQTFVLVHGAWHGGWCWRLVQEALEAQGHSVTAPTLTGLGERAHLLTPDLGLNTHIEDVVQHVLFEELDDIVLVGHSYAGMVITGVVDRIKSRITRIVYLDAAMPEDGESFASQTPGATPALIEKIEQGFQGMSTDGVTMAVFPTTVLGIPDTDTVSTQWVSKHLTPHPLKTWLDQLTLKNGGSTGMPRSYIHCNGPAMESASFPAIYAELSALSDWDTYTLATGHDAMVTAPKELATLLMQIAGSG